MAFTSWLHYYNFSVLVDRDLSLRAEQYDFQKKKSIGINIYENCLR